MGLIIGFIDFWIWAFIIVAGLTIVGFIIFGLMLLSGKENNKINPTQLQEDKNRKEEREWYKNIIEKLILPCTFLWILGALLGNATIGFIVGFSIFVIVVITKRFEKKSQNSLLTK